MKRFLRSSLVVLSVLAIGVTGIGQVSAGEQQRHVVDASEIQARIDQQMNSEDAARQSIQLMLQRSDVRDIAARAGLDIQRASAAAAVLSGAELEALAMQANEINAGIGGSDNIVISATALIIILLIIIIVAR